MTLGDCLKCASNALQCILNDFINTEVGRSAPASYLYDQPATLKHRRPPLHRPSLGLS